MAMTTPENKPRDSKPEVTEEEEQLERQLDATADAARRAGVYDPSETEKKKQ
jgi:hypothetical protein